MRIALIGGGEWGKNLIRNLSDLCVLSHVVDKDPSSLELFSKKYPCIECFDNYELLLESNIDAVVIATPAHSHYEIALAFLKAGKDVFIEKPMTLCSEEAKELVDVAQLGGAILMVGHMLLYQPAIQFIKSYLDQGHVGQIYHLHQERLKLGRVRSKENVVWSLGVHDIAVLIYLVGSAPQDIKCSAHSGVQGLIEDDAYLHMTFESGIIAHLHSSWLWPDNSRCMRIIGSRGMVVYNEMNQSVTLHKKRIGKDLENIDEGEELLFEGSSQPLRLEMEHFIHCIKTRENPISDGLSGLTVIQVLESLEFSNS